MFFLVLIMLRIYVDVSRHHSIKLSNILLLSTFIATFYYKTKTSWLVAVGLCVWGVYYYLVQAVKVAWPGQFEFTLPLLEFADKSGSGFVSNAYVKLIPFLFYIATIAAFMTNTVRKQYWKSAAGTTTV